MNDPNALRDAIMTKLKTLPGMDREGKVAPHGGDVTEDLLKRYAQDAPCLRVALTSLGAFARHSSGQAMLPVHVAIIAITKDTATEGVGRVSRDQSCAALAGAVMALCAGKTNRWGLSGVEPPADVLARNEFTGQLDKTGVAAWQITWRQSVLMGEDFEALIPALAELWINGERFSPEPDSGSLADPLRDAPLGPVLGDPLADLRPLDAGRPV